MSTPSNRDLDEAAARLDGATDRLAAAMQARRELLKTLDKVAATLLTIGEKAALLALQAAINSAIAKGG